MMTTGTQNEYYNATEPVLFMAFELSEKTWKLGFTIGHGQTPRERTIVARDPKRLFEEVAYAKARFGLGHTAPVVSCPGALAPSMVSWHADAAASLTPQALGRRRGGEKGLCNSYPPRRLHWRTQRWRGVKKCVCNSYPVNAAPVTSPMPFMSTLSGLASTVPGETVVRQRRKLWEFPSHLHCSIVGTCLTTELRKIVAKCQEFSLKDLSDLTVHEVAVRTARYHDTSGRLLHKALDRRHEASIKRFNKAQDTHAVRLLWDEALRRGDIPGSYWALLTHWAT